MTSSKKELFQQVEHDINEYISQREHHFISSLSHDMKNAMGIIELSLGLIESKIAGLEEQLGSATIAKFTSLINNSHTGLDKGQQLLTNALCYKREYNMKDEILNIKSLIDQSTIFIKSEFKDYNVQFQNDVDDSIEVTTSRSALMNTIISAVHLIFNKIEKNESYNLEVTNSGKNIKFLIQNKQENPIKIKSTEEACDFFDQKNFDKYSRVSKVADYSLEVSDKNVQITLSFN